MNSQVTTEQIARLAKSLELKQHFSDHLAAQHLRNQKKRNALKQPKDRALQEIRSRLDAFDERILANAAQVQRLQEKLAKQPEKTLACIAVRRDRSSLSVAELLAETDDEIVLVITEKNEWKSRCLVGEQKLAEALAELRRMKALPPKPDLKPNTVSTDLGKVIQGQAPSKKKKKRGGSKKDKKRRNKQAIAVHQEVKLPIPADLPAGFKLLGYQEWIAQDVKIEPNNTRYLIPRLYNRETRKTWPVPLPAGVQGHFGGNVRLLALTWNHEGRIPENKLVKLFRGVGIRISAGQVHSLLTEDLERFHQEKAAILKTGLQVSRVLQIDDMGARHSGKNGSCNVLCNEWFTVFHTSFSKSRLNFLTILTQGKDCYTFNPEALAYLERLEAPEKWIKLMRVKGAQPLNKADLEPFLVPHGLDLDSKVFQNLLEAGLMGALEASGFNSEMIIHSDGARQFDLFAHCLCWIHAMRPFEKLIPSTPHQVKLIQQTLGEFWEFYEALAHYKLAPQPKVAKRLDARFDALFGRKTGYLALNEVLAAIQANKSKYLLVLKRPEAPIHNNLSESEGRETVVRNHISKTGSEAGKQARDTFLSLIKTANKHSISSFDYFKDRIHQRGQIPWLPDLIIQKATRQTPTLAAP